MLDLSKIRNFCIIAHIDHGKSTLADRMLQITKTIDDRVFRDQFLDAMDLEQERGITIKCHPVTMEFKSRDGNVYRFNLIDTPGHVDFTYEVSRSMAACEGAVLVVDASQGVEAQTVANTFLAIDRSLTIIPVINKIDLPNVNIDEVKKQIEDVLGIDTADCLMVSAKTGGGVEEVLEAVIKRIPPPKEDPAINTQRALVFDSTFDNFRGVLPYIRVMNGTFKVGQKVEMKGTRARTEIKEVGIFVPKPKPVESLSAGEVGYFVGTIREPEEVKVGDTVIMAGETDVPAVHGFNPAKPMVFSGIYPINNADLEKCRQSLDKLKLNDSSLTYRTESSNALGFGFRCGFLGLLHMEIVQERLRREFDMDIISTHPSVVYKVFLRNGEQIDVDNPMNLPDLTRIDHIEEPMIRAFIICMNDQISDILKLVKERRGDIVTTESLDTRRVMLTCSLPLNEILTEFHDYLKSVSHGYASMDYEYAGYVTSEIVRLDILLNMEVIDAFSCLVHKDKAHSRGRQMCAVLKEVIPAHMFAVPVQAALGKTIIARETIRPFRKDVLAKLYGGDVTRKRKVLERQKEGKKRMKSFGSVNVPQEAFISVLKSSK